MRPRDTIPTPSSLRKLGWLVLAISVAFAAVLWPFSGAVWWALFIAIVFMPIHRRVQARMQSHASSAALLSLLVIVLIVIVPLALLGASVTQEVMAFVARLRSGEVDFGTYFRQVFEVLPGWLRNILERQGVGTFAELQQQLIAALSAGAKAIPQRVFTAGQLTLEWMLSFFLMLYVLFFLLRDGTGLSAGVMRAMPLAERHKELLATTFVQVVRATIRGNVLVALVQGALGGVAFAFLGISGALLWGAVMAVLSLLPALGTALIWVPVSVYLMATGSLWQGVGLAVWGAVVIIGLIDSMLRPLLVGKGLRIPDYVVLITTLGGLAMFGITGFVIGPVVAALFETAWDLFTKERAAAAQRLEIGTRDRPADTTQPASRAAAQPQTLARIPAPSIDSP